MVLEGLSCQHPHLTWYHLALLHARFWFVSIFYLKINSIYTYLYYKRSGPKFMFKWYWGPTPCIDRLPSFFWSFEIFFLFDFAVESIFLIWAVISSIVLISPPTVSSSLWFSSVSWFNWVSSVSETSPSINVNQKIEIPHMVKHGIKNEK